MYQTGSILMWLIYLSLLSCSLGLNCYRVVFLIFILISCWCFWSSFFGVTVLLRRAHFLNVVQRSWSCTSKNSQNHDLSRSIKFITFKNRGPKKMRNMIGFGTKTSFAGVWCVPKSNTILNKYNPLNSFASGGFTKETFGIFHVQSSS